MDKVKIGDGEYRFPVTIDSCDETYTCISDENCKEVSKNDIVLALNELAQLRSERDALKARVEELEKANVRMTGAIYDWYYAKRDYQSLHPGNHTSEEKSHTVERYLAAERVLRESVNHTTPGGDE